MKILANLWVHRASVRYGRGTSTGSNSAKDWVCLGAECYF